MGMIGNFLDLQTKGGREETFAGGRSVGILLLFAGTMLVPVI